MIKAIVRLIVFIFVVTVFTSCTNAQNSTNTSNTNTNTSISITVSTSTLPANTSSATTSTDANTKINTSPASTSTDGRTTILIGNTSGNVSNGGQAVLHEDWIFFRNNGAGESLYKMKTDGTEEEKVNDDQPAYLNVSDGWIYYLNLKDLKVYKIKPDGEERTLLSEVYLAEGAGTQMVVADDWIYYSILDKEKEGSQLVKVRTYGTDQVELIKTSGMFPLKFYLVGDWIYYTDGTKLNKMKTDGTGKAIVSDEVVWDFNILDNYIYYTSGKNPSGGFGGEFFGLLKMKLDGTGKVVLTDEKVRSMNVSGDWIYYTSEEDNDSGSKPELEKMRLDGSESTVVLKENFEGQIGPINIVGGWILYSGYNNRNEGRSQTLVKTDGTQRRDLKSTENNDDQGKNEDPFANALVGEFDKTYEFSFKGEKGSLKINSIKVLDEYVYGRNRETNVILIEYTSDQEDLHYLDFGFFDKNGNRFKGEVFSMGLKNTNVFTSMDSSLIDFAKYIVISGLDEEKNDGKTGVVFEVKK